MTHVEYLYRAASFRRAWREGRIRTTTLAHRLVVLIDQYLKELP